MMVFVWDISVELCLSEAFPNIIMVDTVEKTDNKKRPFFAVCGKCVNRKMLIFLGYFMTNQYGGMFK